MFVGEMMRVTMEQAEDNMKKIEINVIHIVLYSAAMMMYSAIAIYALRIYKLDVLIQQKNGVKSAVRYLISSAGISCIFFMLSMLFYIFVFGVNIDGISDGMDIAGRIFALCGGGFAGYFIFGITIRTITAMVLAEGGIAAIRHTGFVLIQKYLGYFMIALIICLIPVGITSREAYGIIGASIFFLFASGYGYVSIKFFILSRAEGIQPESLHQQRRIPRRCREIYQSTMIISIGFILNAIIFILLGIYHDIDGYLAWQSYVIVGVLIYAPLHELMRTTVRIKDLADANLFKHLTGTGAASVEGFHQVDV
mmetsp:Transcript_28484/g.33775  ORF Transcript_28484/g.33775 Transcript_28484/m.33775 type:complete len:310 (-) Transcript_28484:151-1080(-)